MGLVLGMGLFFIIGLAVILFIANKSLGWLERWYAQKGKPLKHPWQ